jgi:hypothetical protein
MNPTQFLKFARICIYSENRKINLSATGPKPRSAQMHNGTWPTLAVSAQPMCIARAWPTAMRGATRVRSARPALVGPASACAARDDAAHAGAVTAPGHASRCCRQRYHSGRGGANDGGRAPTTVRLPVGHEGGGDSSLELLVDGEGEKTGSTAAFFRQGGATVATAVLRR